ncbi:hypothetical protein POM88_038823 [Heracleum sosnowskyi]|uniref:Retrotransposon gag domain-containing protein n=1 Tax=Heracleum sosnowskyi TaxID=360622 RepID=A0AAD8H8R2_9APIA|nr:hypothetical protein POM88_038823 [Heracleum sosnowskyi]
MGNTVNRMAERMESLERERRLPERTRRSPDRRRTSIRDRRPPRTNSRRQYATERFHRPGKEPIIDCRGSSRKNPPPEREIRTVEETRQNRRFQAITPRELTYEDNLTPYVEFPPDGPRNHSRPPTPRSQDPGELRIEPYGRRPRPVSPDDPYRRIDIYRGRYGGERRSPPWVRTDNQVRDRPRNSQFDDDVVILDPVQATYRGGHTYQETQDSRRPRLQDEQTFNQRRVAEGTYTPEPTYQQREPTPRRPFHLQGEATQQQTEPTPQQGQNPNLAIPNLQQEPAPNVELGGGIQTIPGFEGINVNALRRLIAQSEGQGGAIPDATPSPFSAAVREAPLPPAFRGTGDLRFNGSTDPTEYIGRFNTEMELYQVEDLTKCRLLASTLRGNAHQWFQKLGPASITSWEQMRKMFLIQFQSSIHYAPPVTTLANIKQRDGETLQEYFKRFNAEVPTVRGASEETIKNFLIAGVRVGTDFWKNLQREEPSTLAALYLQVEPFKREEEALKRSDYGDAPRRNKRKERSPSPKTEKKNGREDVNLVEDNEPTRSKSISPKGNKGKDRFIRSRSPSPPSCPPPPPNRRENQTVPRKYYTPLTASIDYIYEITKSQGLFKKPAPLSRSATKDKGRYCAYHESHRHHTYACKQLKEEIEKLIKEGKLTDWVVKEVKKYKEEAPVKVTEVIEGSTEGKELEKPVFVREEIIHTIFGGPHIGGNGRNAMERYVREAQHPPLTNVNHLSERPPKLFKGEDIQIIFSEEDARWVHHPHSDALVVNVRIGSRNVHRVFVDTGSSVNILYYGTYKKMGFLDKELTQGTTHIYGFTGDSVRVKGTIRLPLTLGEGTLSATQVFDFLVVDQPTHYNALLGRPVLKEMRIVTSIYHLSMKFPTPTGVGCIKGCQYDSRDCYSRMIRSSRKGSKGVGEDSDMSDFDQESTQETQASFKPPYASTNMVYSIEFPEEERLQDYEALARDGIPIFFLEAPPPVDETADMLNAKEVFQEDKIPLNQKHGVLMIGAPPPNPFYEGIVEDASDDEADQRSLRAKKGKMIMEDGLEPLIEFPAELSEALSSQLPRKDEVVSVQEVGESSGITDVEFDLDPRLPENDKKIAPAEDTLSILMEEVDPPKILQIGARLESSLRARLFEFLKKNLDVFAWSHADMVGIDPDVMCHHLNIDPLRKKGFRQKRRPISGERAIALKEEVDRLMQVGLVKESFYPNWLANPVLVKKPNGKWRVCIDFTDLNKACPKDSFPLPRIDQMVDATAGHTLLSFMDAYSGYNQIPMYEPDQEDTSFITDRGLYCYIGMPFGLINAGATYQRLVNMMFKE